MILNKNWKQQNINGAVPILISAAGFILLVCLLSFGAAYLIHNEQMSFNSAKWVGLMISFISAFIGNLMLIKNMNEGFIIRVLISAGSMIVIWAIIGMLFFDGLSSAGWGNLIAILIGGLAVLVIPYIKPSKPSYKKYGSR